MELVLMRWGTVQAAFVARDKASALAFIGRCKEVAPVKLERRVPFNSLPDCEVTRGWRTNAEKMGAIWALGFAAVVF